MFGTEFGHIVKSLNKHLLHVYVFRVMSTLPNLVNDIPEPTLVGNAGRHTVKLEKLSDFWVVTTLISQPVHEGQYGQVKLRSIMIGFWHVSEG